jgi:hypothetical protein
MMYYDKNLAVLTAVIAQNVVFWVVGPCMKACRQIQTF